MRLIIHVGHAKTGSSFIQSSLARNSEQLQAHGIFYPKINDRLARPVITSGNARFVLQNLAPPPPKNTEAYVISDEAIFVKMKHFESIPVEMHQLMSMPKFTSVEFILFIRDPVEHVESHYHQGMKNHGHYAPITQYFEKDQYPAAVLSFLDVVKRIKNSKLHVFNYSRHKSDVLAPVLSVLGVGSLPDTSYENKRINRSLTAAEAELFRSINSEAINPMNALSAALCNELPHIKSEKLYPSLEVQNAMLSRLKGEIDAVNARIPKEEGYQNTTHKPYSEFENFSLKKEQISLIGTTLGKKLRALDQKNYLLEAEVKILTALATENESERQAYLIEAKDHLAKVEFNSETENNLIVKKRHLQKRLNVSSAAGLGSTPKIRGQIMGNKAIRKLVKKFGI